ncbi:hypothetical protein [Schlesneria sp.]|uniref:hypothetical protein n=1 Tax=Schlesneria sp. TaxID=2762018 RepID=UPI002F0A8FD1
MKTWKLIRSFGIRALLFMVFNTMLTGVPIPLWSIEYLDHPQKLHSVTRTHLVLEDGQQVTLPYIKELPENSSLFMAALSNGVETSPDGTAWGLIWSDRLCGNDFVVWRRRRVDLCLLAATLHPEGIDATLVSPDDMAFILETCRINTNSNGVSHRRNRLAGYDWIYMRRVEKVFQETHAKIEVRPGKAEEEAAKRPPG